MILRLTLTSEKDQSLSVSLTPELADELAEQLQCFAAAVRLDRPHPKLLLPLPEGQLRAALGFASKRLRTSHQ